MTATVTGTFDTTDQVRNFEDDLLAMGIPGEKIFANEQAKEIKAIIPEVSKPEIVEILNRNKPINVN